MRSKFQKLVDEYQEYKSTVHDIIRTKGPSAYQQSHVKSLLGRAQRVMDQIVNFGTQVPLMRVEIAFRPMMGTEGSTQIYSDIVSEEFFLTDVSHDEAIQYAKYRYRTAKIETLRALKVPLGSPETKK